MELKAKISEIRKQLGSLENQQMGIDAFVGAIRKFMQMQTLTASLLHELIDYIDVFKVDGRGKNKTQRIVISYRFAGYVEMPAARTQPQFAADIRQGVAINYVA